jgi:hypothetical protein
MTLLSGTLSAPAVMSALYSNLTAFGFFRVVSGRWLQADPPRRLDCTGLAFNCKPSHFTAFLALRGQICLLMSFPVELDHPFRSNGVVPPNWDSPNNGVTKDDRQGTAGSNGAGQ